VLFHWFICDLPVYKLQKVLGGTRQLTEDPPYPSLDPGLWLAPLDNDWSNLTLPQMTHSLH